jgi:hypothetical protein
MDASAGKKSSFSWRVSVTLETLESDMVTDCESPFSSPVLD